jgi:hypothetical protein
VHVAECIYTSSERKKIEAVAFELTEAIDEFFEDVRPSLSEAEWSLLVSYAMGSIRRALEVAPLLHAVVDKQRDARPYPGRGRMTFVRAALAAWRDAFTPIEAPWRLAPVFEKIPGGEQRALADVAALEVMAANRMFATLDEQCAALLSDSREG